MTSYPGIPTSDGQHYASGPYVSPSSLYENRTLSTVTATMLSNHSGLEIPPPMDTFSLVGLSLLFFLIVFFGVLGNALVMVVILKDAKMRRSVTNLLIVNLAFADLVIMLFGIPEIVMFMNDRGWVLGPIACRAHRYILVISLYCSVLSLVTLCFERFIAIVFPLKVNKWCTRRSTLLSIFLIWIIASLCGLPVALFNRIGPPNSPIQFCKIILPASDRSEMQRNFWIYKYLESIFFYFLPMAIQIVLYSIIANRLYASNEQLRTRFQMRPYRSRMTSLTNTTSSSSLPETQRAAASNGVDTIRARRGVVKMLVCCVLLYFVSYSPYQVHLIYDTFSHTKSKFLSSRQFFIFVLVITHINSAANPFMYGIFSQNFRRQFKHCLLVSSCRKERTRRINRPGRVGSFSSTRFLSTRSTMTSRTLASRV